MSELAGHAKGGYSMSPFSDFEVTSAAELEAHVNMRAIAARANFDKYYAEKLTDVSKLWVDQKRRLDVRQPFEVPTVTIDCGVSGFDCTTVPRLFNEEAARREAAKAERALAVEKGGDDGGASLEVDHRVDQTEPLQLKLMGVDYTNADKVVAALLTGECSPLRIDLCNNGMEASESEALGRFIAANTAVTALDLSGNQLGNDGMEHIVAGLLKNTNLTSLDLGAADISKSGMVKLAEAIASPQCTLQRLRLGGNKLGIYGGEAIAEALAKNTSLKAVGLQNNNLGNDGLQKLLDIAFGGEAAVAAIDAETARLHSAPPPPPPAANAPDAAAAAEEAPPVPAGNRAVVQFSLEGNKASDELMDAIARIVAANDQRQARAHLVALEATERAARLGEFEAENAGLFDVVKRSLQSMRAAEAEAAAVKGGAKSAAKPPAGAAAGAKAPAGKAPAKGAAKAPAAKPAAKAASRTASPAVKPVAKTAPAKAPAAKLTSAKVAAAAAGGAKRSPSPKKAAPKK